MQARTGETSSLFIVLRTRSAGWRDDSGPQFWVAGVSAEKSKQPQPAGGRGVAPPSVFAPRSDITKTRTIPVVEWSGAGRSGSGEKVVYAVEAHAEGRRCGT